MVTRRKKLTVAGAVLGAAAVGIGTGIALERLLVGKRRSVPDPYSREPYGRLRAERSYEVKAADGAVLSVHESGPERALTGVVLLHGFCLDHTIWHHQLKEIQSPHRFVLYDARHHGGFYGGGDATDTRVLASDLKAVLDHSGLKRVILVGHSMGGMTVLEYCREQPAETGRRVRGLVLVNTTYTDAIRTLAASEIVGPIERRSRRILNAIFDDKRARRLVRLRGDDLSWLITKLFGFGSGASPAQIEFIQQLLTCFPSPQLIDTMRGLRKFDMEAALSKIDVPTIVIAGGDDRVTTVRASAKIAEEIEGAKLVVFDGAGHMTMLEKNREFNELLTEFAEATLGSSGSARRSSGGSKS